MNKIWARLGILAMISFPMGAMAAPIVQTAACGPPAEVSGPGAGTCVTGILGLEILGVTYDVSIQVDTGANVFNDEINPSPVPTFWNDQAGAIAAVDAIVSALNSVGGIAGATGVAGSRYFIDVPWDSGGLQGFQVEFASTFTTTWSNGGTGSCGFVLGCVTEGWALFSRVVAEPPQEVPEPGTLALLGLGLSGMGLTRRRKKMV